MTKTSLPKLNIWILTFSFALGGCSQQQLICKPNWKITGFYTPKSSDFDSSLNKGVKIRNFKSLTFNRDFIKAVELEGWGKTRFGWYLGYYGGQWHKKNSPLNSLGHPLTLGAVAVDNRVIAKNTSVQIPAIENLLDLEQFVAVDVGSSVKNRHIDVYVGESEKAKALSFKVTGHHQVCFSAEKTKAPVVSLVK